jgi:hypothetical protein
VGSALAVIGVVGVILYHGYMTRPGWVGVSDKKFWDYLDLLIVPVAIAMGVALINWMQNERQRRDDEAQQRRELELQDQRAQDEALQAYLDQLTLLLVTKQGQGLIRMKVDDDVRQVVQARSEPLLRSLNTTRRFSLILFLSGMGLIERDRSLISLAGADLRGVDARGAPLEAVDLGGANLSEAILYGANLNRSNLREADLGRAYLGGADLSRADLREANLSGAYLRGAVLEDANLSNAYLSSADLSGAHGVTGEQLAQARPLQNATMPNGQKYEDWLIWREPITYDLELFQRDLDPAARGVLREDIPNYWKADLHALSHLTTEQVLRPWTFDELPEENKFIVISLVRHVVDVLNHRYIRKEPVKVKHLETMWQFRGNFPILYVSNEAMWNELVRLASVPGADGAISAPAAKELDEFLDRGLEQGSLVSSRYLEQCLEHGRGYYEDFAQSASRSPVLDMNDLNSDDMHAFLCAYDSCFHP